MWSITQIRQYVWWYATKLCRFLIENHLHLPQKQKLGMRELCRNSIEIVHISWVLIESPYMRVVSSTKISTRDTILYETKITHCNSVCIICACGVVCSKYNFIFKASDAKKSWITQPKKKRLDEDKRNRNVQPSTACKLERKRKSLFQKQFLQEIIMSEKTSKAF